MKDIKFILYQYSIALLFFSSLIALFIGPSGNVDITYLAIIVPTVLYTVWLLFLNYISLSLSKANKGQIKWIGLLSVSFLSIVLYAICLSIDLDNQPWKYSHFERITERDTIFNMTRIGFAVMLIIVIISARNLKRIFPDRNWSFLMLELFALGMISLTPAVSKAIKNKNSAEDKEEIGLGYRLN